MLNFHIYFWEGGKDKRSRITKIARHLSATLGSVGTAVYRNQIADNIPVDTPPKAAEAASDTLVGAAEATQKLSDPLGMELLAIAREAFTSGMNTVATVSAIMLIGVAIFAVYIG